MNPVTEIAEVASIETAGHSTLTHPNFDDPNLFDWLLAAKAAEVDDLSFGVVTMALDGTVEQYNATEGKLAGLTPSRVLGRSFFEDVAPCMNNFMVAHRFEMEAQKDAVIDYVLTLRMAPKKVRLRMLKRSGAEQMHIIIERRV